MASYLPNQLFQVPLVELQPDPKVKTLFSFPGKQFRIIVGQIFIICSL